jgi:hypothetical protein
MGRLQHQRFLRVERMSDQPHQNTLHFRDGHVHMLNHSSVPHFCRYIRYIPPPTCLRQVIETLEDNVFPMGETVSDIRKIVMRITGRRMKVLPPQSLTGISGFDHGVGHPLLLLYDAKAPNCQKSKEFKGLGHYPSNTALSIF